MELPHILDKSIPRNRILSNRGINEAIELGLIRITPPIDLTDRRRLQPATLDVKVHSIDFEGKYTLGARQISEAELSEVNLTELIDFGQLSQGRNPLPLFLGVSSEVRSSVRRFGGFMAYSGRYFFPESLRYSQLEMGNFSCNDIHFERGERIAQLFFFVHPFIDGDIESMLSPRYEEIKIIGEKVRSLDMGMEILSNEELRVLEERGLIRVSPKLKAHHGTILVHASDRAYRMKKIDGGIDFSRREIYSIEDLLEPININNGYEVKSYEHIIIGTIENFELSPHVGIRFWDNLLHQIYRDWNLLENDVCLARLTDGWVDPGYRGGFSRQPKWIGRLIYPGYVVGFGQVFYFPNEIKNAYGKKELGSQYQSKEEIRFSK